MGPTSGLNGGRQGSESYASSIVEAVSAPSSLSTSTLLAGSKRVVVQSCSSQTDITGSANPEDRLICAHPILDVITQQEGAYCFSRSEADSKELTSGREQGGWYQEIKAAVGASQPGAGAELGARWPLRPGETNISLWESVKLWQVKGKLRNTDRSLRRDKVIENSRERRSVNKLNNRRRAREVKVKPPSAKAQDPRGDQININRKEWFKKRRGRKLREDSGRGEANKGKESKAKGFSAIKLQGAPWGKPGVDFPQRTVGLFAQNTQPIAGSMGCRQLKTEGGEGGGSYASSMVEATYTSSGRPSTPPACSRIGGRQRNTRKKDQKNKLFRIKRIRKKDRYCWRVLRIATLNMRGLAKPGKWYEVEDWMSRKKIDILLLQETKMDRTQEVVRSRYTWLLSGNDEGNFTHYGVGIVFKNELRGRIIDKQGGGDRKMRIRLQADKQVEIINCYAPIARALFATEAQMEKEKDTFYDGVKKWVKEAKGSRIKLVAGDFNSRIQTRYEGEEKHIGKYTFSPESVDIESRDSSIVDNRMRLVDLLVEEDLVAMNTVFKKQNQKLFTYTEDKGGKKEPPFVRFTGSLEERNKEYRFETLDYMCIQHRWRNGCMNVENDLSCKLATDHVPLVSDFRFKLKKLIKKGKGEEEVHEGYTTEEDGF